MARITGLGGIFYKVADPDRTKAWYAENLGLSGDYGILFGWKGQADSDPFSMVSPFGATTDYFEPSSLPFMINLRVDDIDGVVEELKGKGIEILGRQDEDYGRFAWILDCDGVKIELWQQLGPSPA
jgi:catechol 2,3-dioxygenase-like lactoylglutathione lyase family enzyme